MNITRKGQIRWLPQNGCSRPKALCRAHLRHRCVSCHTAVIAAAARSSPRAFATRSKINLAGRGRQAVCVSGGVMETA